VNEAPLLDRLRSDPDHAEWYEALNAAEPVPGATWPDAAAFEEFLEIAAVPEEDRPIVRDLLPVAQGDPDLRWVIEHYVWLLAARIGVPGYQRLPPLPDGFGEVAPHLFTFVHAVHWPLTCAFFDQRGVPDEIVRATMADIGRHYVIERVQCNRSGLDGGERWLTFHARGLIYQLGRLQFEMAPLGGRTSQALQGAGVACEEGEPVIMVHIPGFMGPFPPDACDASFAMAKVFFARHFPEWQFRLAICESWLLDPQLAGYLPETSNIIQFQRRFHLAYPNEPNNDSTLGFVFRSPGTPLDELPQRTRLERAVVSHIRAGKSWTGGTGWLALADGPAGPLSNG
jgi:hypothetical protein